MKRLKLMKARQATVLIHGFMGSPRQFDALIPMLDAEEADIYNATLPGHEAALEDFVRYKACDCKPP
ncbi:MAG: hypothetical protein Q4B42_02460 [Oscillospiraceae bacterium]|nr:hypothetical protein [Oscillospiraceae bacterium]